MTTSRNVLARLMRAHAPSTTTERLRPLPAPSAAALADRADRELEARRAEARREAQARFDTVGLPRGL